MDGVFGDDFGKIEMDQFKFFCVKYFDIYFLGSYVLLKGLG